MTSSSASAVVASRRPARGAVGGAAGEAGSIHRAGVAAIAIVHGLVGQGVPWLPHDASPVRVTLEGDAEIDDIVIELDGGLRAFIQAKLAADMGRELKATVDQWVRAFNEGTIGPGDSVVLAVANPSRNVRHLAIALDARRRDRSMNKAQGEALEKLERLVEAGLTRSGDVAAVLDAAWIAVVDGRNGTADTDAGAAWLDNTVVAAGHGRRGFATLRATLPTVASRRESAGIDEWRAWLREAGVPAHSDPLGVLAAQRQAADDAIVQYRLSKASDADLLPLHALAGGVEPLPLPGLGENVAVHPAGETAGRRRRGRRSGNDSVALLDVARREGRLLLVGQPGAGKSVALQQVAAYVASVPHAPVPIVLSLKQVAELLPRERTAPLRMAELVELATADTEDVLHNALREKIKAGNAILLLDALDETHDARDRVIHQLRHLLAAAQPELDIVISSRHSAAEAATSLGLAEYILETPSRFDDTIHKLLEHLTPAQLTANVKHQWLSVRRDYIKRSQREEPTIWSVPLLATLAVLLLTERGPNRMPATRASLLHEVVRDSVRRWAAHRPDIGLPSLDMPTSAAVLVDTFADIASVVAQDGQWHKAKEAVANRLKKHWHLAPGTADTVAERVIDHWDATAGVFVTNSPRGQLTARARLFTEIGDALWHTRNEDDIHIWIGQAVADTERWETVRLAAGLTPEAAAALVRGATSTPGEFLDLACDAWADGARLTDADAAALVTAQLHRLSQASMDVPPVDTSSVRAFLTDRTPPFTSLAMRLAELPLSDAQVADLIELCQQLPERQLDVITAVAAANQATVDVESPDSDTLDQLERALLTDDEIELSNDDRHAYRPDRRYGLDAVINAALTVLLPARPNCAQRIAHTAYNSSIGAYERVVSELHSRGLDDALREVRTGWSFGSGIDWERMAKNLQEPYETIRTSLEATPVTLTASQAWHLDEAAALIDAMRVAAQTAGAPGTAVHQFKDQAVALISAFIEAARLPQSVVVAQLNQIYSENPDRPEWGLLFRPSCRLRVDSLDVRPEHLTVAAEALKTGNIWLATAACDLYLDADHLSDDQAQALLTDIQSMSAWSRRDAAIALTANRPDIGLPLNDPAIRAGDAAVRTYKLVNDNRATDAIKYLTDPDLMVHAAAASQLQDVDAEDMPVLQAALAEPATQWTCPWCDAVRSIDDDACPGPGPSHSRPEPKLGE